MSGEIDLNDLCRLSATAAVDLLRRREVSPLEFLDASAARIAETDSILNAIPTLCLDRARDRAKALMRSPPADSAGHFLHGLPIVVKDNVEVQGVRCTFGSAIFADYVSPESDPVVQRLEANGALVVGKSNIPEFAAGGNTFNDMFGITRNPWNANYTPGGSSGGTAAALAAGQVWLGTGNDFGGSIRIPASFCSLVGLRPTPGTVPRVQKQPYSPLNVEGPLARSVMDCALMLECEAGRHPLDPLSAEIVPGSFMRAAAIPYRPKLAALSLDLGIAPTVASEVAGVFGLLGDKLAGAGCDVEAACPDLQDAIAIFRTLRGVSFAGNMRTLLEKERHRLKSDVIANAEFGLGLTIAEVVTAELAHGELVRRVARFFERFDVLICPTVLCPPVKVEERHVSELNGIRLGDYLGWLVMTCAISVTGCPVLALPCGFTRQGLPVGVQVIGPVGSDARLLAIGAFLEQVLDVSPRVPIATSASRSTVPRSAA